MQKRVMLAFTLLLVWTGVASAQWTDYFANSTNIGSSSGMPSLGEACEGLSGAAYGMCKAYCEGMECDSSDPQATPSACARVADRIRQIAGVVPSCSGNGGLYCPCVGGVTDWNQAINGAYGLTACVGTTIPGGDDYVALQTDSPYLLAGSDAAYYANTGFCGFAAGTGAFLVITLQEAESCNALIRQKAAAAGLTCPPAQ